MHFFHFSFKLFVRVQHIRSGSLGRFWITGVHPVICALENPKRKCLQLFATTRTFPLVQELVRTKVGLKVQIVSKEAFTTLLPPHSTHQHLALEVFPLSSVPLKRICQNGKPIVVLDGVEDPQNVGAIIRSATAFGVEGVITQKRRAFHRETTSLAKTAAGTLEICHFLQVSNIAQTLKQLKTYGYWLIGLLPQAPQHLSPSTSPPRPFALVLGAEDKGLRTLVQQHCDFLYSIPMENVQSLNVAAAAAVALFTLSQSTKPPRP